MFAITSLATSIDLSDAGRTGKAVTAGAANTKGDYAEMIAALPDAADHLFYKITHVAGSGADTGAFLDVATGAAASESIIVPDLNVGQAGGGIAPSGKFGPLPVAVADGARLSARVQTVPGSTAPLLSLWAVAGVHITPPSSLTAYGVNTTTGRGVSVAGGDSAYGSAVEIGTLSADANIFKIQLDAFGDLALGAGDDDECVVQIGYGPDSGNITWLGIPTGADEDTAVGGVLFGYSTSEEVLGPWPYDTFYAEVDSGQKLWARLAAGGTTARGISIHAGLGTLISEGGGGLALAPIGHDIVVTL